MKHYHTIKKQGPGDWILAELHTSNRKKRQSTVVYFRRDQLSPRDQQDLDIYTDMLRNYWGIPEGEPVFPEEDAPEKRAERTGKPLRAHTPPGAGRNSAKHPWRVHL